MKKLATLLLAAPGLAYAGPISEEIATIPEAEYWIKPTIDIRARYEFGDVDGSDVSHAFTLRERLGLQTQEWNGFSAFIEGEFTQAPIDDFESVPGPGAVNGGTPDDVANTQIFDPETNELNQGYLQYKGFDTTFRVGRQRIIYNNAAFIGNVGWRQNEQTYDAFSVSTTAIPGLKADYSFISQVNRIFGSDAINNFDYDTSSIHLFNAAYTGIEGITLGAYAYIMDFDSIEAYDNNTYGGFVKASVLGLDYHGEYAYQDHVIDAAGNKQSGDYAHVSLTKKIGTQSITGGVEYLSADFRTPLATVHAFNGFADVFITQRLFGTTNGLTDAYLSHTMPIFAGIKMVNAVHAYGDNEFSAGRGWEIDSVLVKKFDEHFTGILKVAHFETESALPTTTRVTVGLNYKF